MWYYGVKVYLVERGWMVEDEWVWKLLFEEEGRGFFFVGVGFGVYWVFESFDRWFVRSCFELLDYYVLDGLF